jgi:hypothetical protein
VSLTELPWLDIYPGPLTPNLINLIQQAIA